MMDLVTRLRYRSSTYVYPTDTALTLMAEAADLITQLRGDLSLAEEGLANYAQENERLRAALERIEKSRYAIEGFDTDAEVIESQHGHIMMLRGIAREARGSVPQSGPTK